MIDGSIGSLGKSYVVTIQATNCQSGATLAREQVQADVEPFLLSQQESALLTRENLGQLLE